ncbi:MAG: hypothetical protein HY063_12375 [Bacteroidetes bacterium]|nr:hypothetical protein [Bacteroidota bacterium]
MKSLKKFLQRNKQRANPRHAVILHALSRAERKGFSFGKNTEPLLKELSGGNCKWEFLSHELIPFHEWAREKTGAAAEKAY